MKTIDYLINELIQAGQALTIPIEGIRLIFIFVGRATHHTRYRYKTFFKSIF
jgi:hypothetical protein